MELAKVQRSQTRDKFTLVVLLHMAVAIYAASVVGVMFFLGHSALTPTGLLVALLGFVYALVPGLLGLTAAYWLTRGVRREWLRAGTCVLLGGLAGFLWFALLISAERLRDHLDTRVLEDFALFHTVPGAAGGLVFWLLGWASMRHHADGNSP